MPYIEQKYRDEYDPLIEALAIAVMNSGIRIEGKLNYIITRLLHTTLGFFRSYASYSLIIATLEAVKQEYYRRVVAPYEDKKREENGDVYV